jgi:hypothetical protein
MARTGLSNSGRTKPLPSEEKFISSPTATKPQPIIAPVRACVVEIGKPVSVARMTVRPAPIATASKKYSEPAK